ncbi:competence/damage-inducible protein CinA [Russula earlei]|uniref:Competence/damage-inducible protein CinA n=1 Tax=Russula earlei TaxID=71964 RepID=A0ACC0TUH7_9AGAM|nr:competence/damage-inducible protein CinA [Russula earlei]
MDKVFASIITIGDELLIGQVVDTNSAWMAQELNKIGVWLHHRVAIGDVKEEIVRALEEEGKRSHVVLITGGLGPTADDITKPVLNEYFGGKLVVNEEALDRVKAIFRRLNMPETAMLERNLKQAEVPDTCTVIQNAKGTAPGMWFEKDGKVFQFTMPHIGHRTLLTAGIGESALAEHIKDFEEALPAHFKLAYLPNFGMVRLRLTANGAIATQIEQELDTQFSTLQAIIPDVTVVNEDIPMEELIGRLLLQKNATLATAESCTGGYIAHLITAIPGSSAYFNGSIVSYSNQVKKEVLQVSEETLATDGAVSESTVKQMVTQVRRLLHTDYAIAVSGIMGPGGATPDKPVGLVWIAVADAKQVVTKQFNFRFDRTRNIQLTAISALNLLRLLIVDNQS